MSEHQQIVDLFGMALDKLDRVESAITRLAEAIANVGRKSPTVAQVEQIAASVIATAAAPDVAPTPAPTPAPETAEATATYEQARAAISSIKKEIAITILESHGVKKLSEIKDPAKFAAVVAACRG